MQGRSPANGRETVLKTARRVLLQGTLQKNASTRDAALPCHNADRERSSRFCDLLWHHIEVYRQSQPSGAPPGFFHALGRAGGRKRGRSGKKFAIAPGRGGGYNGEKTGGALTVEKMWMLCSGYGGAGEDMLLLELQEDGSARKAGGFRWGMAPSFCCQAGGKLYAVSERGDGASVARFPGGRDFPGKEHRDPRRAGAVPPVPSGGHAGGQLL